MSGRENKDNRAKVKEVVNRKSGRRKGGGDYIQILPEVKEAGNWEVKERGKKEEGTQRKGEKV